MGHGVEHVERVEQGRSEFELKMFKNMTYLIICDVANMTWPCSAAFLEGVLLIPNGGVFTGLVWLMADDSYSFDQLFVPDRTSYDCLVSFVKHVCSLGGYHGLSVW